LSSGKVRGELNMKSAPEELLLARASYSVDILIGSFSQPHPLKYNLGIIHIETPLDVSGKSKTGTDEVHGPKPTIEHLFRTAEKMPPSWFSSLFALIVLSPWLVLIGIWSTLKISFKPFLASSPKSIITIASFLVFIAAVDHLFYRFWTDLDIFQTLTYLAILTPIGFVTGQQALSVVQERRLVTENVRNK